MKKLIVFGVVFAVMAGAAFAVTKFFLAPKPAGDATAETQAEGDEAGGDEGGPGHVFMVEQLLVNPTGTSGTRFLSTSLGLEVSSQETLHTLEERQMQVRDLLITILSARTVEQLTSMSEREKMREEIIARTNTMIAPEELTAVYFVDYVLQ